LLKRENDFPFTKQWQGIDIVAESKCGRVVLVEVKKTPAKTGLNTVEDFQEKVEAYRRLFPEKTILPRIYQGSETLL